MMRSGASVNKNLSEISIEGGEVSQSRSNHRMRVDVTSSLKQGFKSEERDMVE